MITPEDLKLCNEAIKDFKKKNKETRRPRGDVTDLLGASWNFREDQPSSAIYSQWQNTPRRYTAEDLGTIYPIGTITNRASHVAAIAQDTYMDALVYGTGVMEIPAPPPVISYTSPINHIRPLQEAINQQMNTIRDNQALMALPNNLVVTNINHEERSITVQAPRARANRTHQQQLANAALVLQESLDEHSNERPRSRTTTYRELQFESYYNNIRMVISQQQVSDSILKPFIELLQDDRVIKILVNNHANYDESSIIVTRDHDDHDKTYEFPIAKFISLAIDNAGGPYWMSLVGFLVA